MIGVFDSGSGGLSVVKALRELAPQADLVYFGDLKNAPYGNKSREELGALTVLGIQKLIDAGAREIVSACNSVSVSIVLPMFEILDIPRVSLIEMVGPTIAALKGQPANVLILATRATVESGVYQGGFRMIGSEARAIAVPELVELIERGASDEDMLESIRTALEFCAGQTCTTVTHVLLGCTHYPLVRRLFKDALAERGMHAHLFDPAQPVAETVARRFDTSGTGTLRFIVSQDTEQFRMHIARQLGGVPHTVEVV